MYFIAAGFIFVFFYLNIPIGGLYIDLLFDTLGYGLIAYGLRDVREGNAGFGRGFVVSIVMGAYYIATRFFALPGLAGLALEAAGYAGTLLLVKLIIDGVAQLEQDGSAQLGRRGLERWGLAVTAGYAAVLVLSAGAQFIDGLELLNVAASMVRLAVCVGLEVCLFKTASKCAVAGTMPSPRRGGRHRASGRERRG